jgi:uncharacterized protein
MLQQNAIRHAFGEQLIDHGTHVRRHPAPFDPADQLRRLRQRGRGPVDVVSACPGADQCVVEPSAQRAITAGLLWSELHDKGVDVLGLILGKTDTPALRRLEAERGTTQAADQPLPDAATVDDVLAEAFENLGKTPTWIVGKNVRAGMQMLSSLPRADAVALMTAATATGVAGEG